MRISRYTNNIQKSIKKYLTIKKETNNNKVPQTILNNATNIHKENIVRLIRTIGKCTEMAIRTAESRLGAKLVTRATDVDLIL